MTTPLLRAEALNVFYDLFRAVSHLDFEVGEGEIVSIIGSNGAGKSSFLKAIVGQVGRTEGKLSFEGRDLASLTTPEIVRAGIALVPEGRRLFPSLSVAENLRIGWEIGRRGAIDIAQIYSWFPALDEIKARPARVLSGGQQQKVALARALLTNPKLLLCDEISLGLAPLVVNQIYDLIPTIRAAGISIVLVEQDVGRSLACADRFYCLLEGEVSLTGKPGDYDRDTIMQHYFGV